MRSLGLGVASGGGAVDHDRPFEAVLALEGSYILPDLLSRLSQGAVLLFVGSLDPGDVAGIKDRREGPYFLELITHGVQVLFFEDPGEGGGVVGAVGEGIPAAEDEVIYSGQGDEVLYLRDLVPIWVKEPTGPARLFFTSSTPAMKVVATAPIPGIKTPILPAGSLISLASIILSSFGPPTSATRPGRP